MAFEKTTRSAFSLRFPVPRSLPPWSVAHSADPGTCLKEAPACLPQAGHRCFEVSVRTGAVAAFLLVPMPPSLHITFLLSFHAQTFVCACFFVCHVWSLHLSLASLSFTLSLCVCMHTSFLHLIFHLPSFTSFLHFFSSFTQTCATGGLPSKS